MNSGKEKCQMIHSWTFNRIVGSFLDLVIAFLLLSVSAIAYIASKFLGFFGLSLPCPCNGLFGNPNHNLCLQRVLVNSPSQGIRFSVKTKLPIDLTLTDDQNDELHMKSIMDRKRENVHAELQVETPCSSVTNRKQKRYALTKGGKGKGSAKGRRGKVAGYGMFSSLDASYDMLQLDALDKTNGNSETVNSVDGSEAPKRDGSQEIVIHDFESSEPFDEHKSAEHAAFTAKEFMYTEQEDTNSDSNDANLIRDLEQELAEEHAVRAALHSELEKERTAAATAANEAMNMILRLQEEKATVEMEARHYHKIIEAKSIYDAEEMNILREILLRREHEKHFLEKEVDAYRKRSILFEQLDEDKDKMKSNIDFTNSSTDYDVTSIESEDHTFGDIHWINTSESSDIQIFDNVEIQEKGPVLMEDNLHSMRLRSGMRRSSMSVIELKSHNDAEKGVSKISESLPSRGKRLNPGMRRRSMSALDNERLKLEAEVECLREKLKMVQKGKEKLNISVDDITSQLQEITPLTEHGNATPDAILPPYSSSSKVKSKKRSCRTVM